MTVSYSEASHLFKFMHLIMLGQKLIKSRYQGVNGPTSQKNISEDHFMFIIRLSINEKKITKQKIYRYIYTYIYLP